MNSKYHFLFGLAVFFSDSISYCKQPLDESVIVASPYNRFPKFFVMSPGDGKNNQPRGSCYQVDDNGNFHLKWRINGLYQRSDIYLGPWGEVLARIVDQHKQLTGEEPMLELYRNGKLFKKYLVKDFFKKPGLLPIVAGDTNTYVSTVEFRKVQEIPQFVFLENLQETPGFYEFPRFKEFQYKYVFTFVTTEERERFVVNIEDGSILAHWNAMPIDIGGK
jgi:hypothetical protein